MGLKKFFKKIEKQTRVNLKHLSNKAPYVAANAASIMLANCAKSYGEHLGEYLAPKKNNKLVDAKINSNNTNNFFGDSAVAGALNEITQKTEQKQQSK